MTEPLTASQRAHLGIVTGAFCTENNCWCHYPRQDALPTSNKLCPCCHGARRVRVQTRSIPLNHVISDVEAPCPECTAHETGCVAPVNQPSAGLRGPAEPTPVESGGGSNALETSAAPPLDAWALMTVDGKRLTITFTTHEQALRACKRLGEMSSPAESENAGT